MKIDKNFRNIIPIKIPKRLWRSKEYDYIILYALEVFGPMYQQEFVNRPRINNRIPEKTFYNHIKKLEKKGFVEFKIESNRRRKIYNITPKAEYVLKNYLRDNIEKYGELYLKLEDLKYYEKKLTFCNDFDNYLNSYRRIEENFLRKLVDLSHFYPRTYFEKYIEFDSKLRNEEILKKKLIRVHTEFIKLLNDYKEKIELDFLESEKEIFYKKDLHNYKIYCPKCKRKELIDYGNDFECMNCRLEFDKASLELLEDENIIANQEKKNFIDAFKELIEDDSNNQKY